jgi:hypothetical protein
MTPLKEFHPLILPRVPRCPTPTVNQAIRQAAQRFCERTKLWRETDSFQIGSEGMDYVFAPPGAVLYEIETARFNGQRLQPASIPWLDDNLPNWRELSGSVPRYVTQTEIDTVRVVPADTGQVDLTVILRPSDDAQDLPDFIARSHRTAIRDGALAELMMLPGQPFFNPELAMIHNRKFEAELDRLTMAAVKGQQRAPVRTIANFF